MIRRKSSRRILRRSSTTSRNYSSYQPRVVRALPLRAVHYAEGHFPSAGAPFPANAARCNPDANLLNGIQKGSSIFMRTGNRIRMLSLMINGGIYCNPWRTAAANSASAGPYNADAHFYREQNVSLLIMYCPAPQATVPPLSDYYSNSPSTGVVDTWSMRRVVEMPTMRLLKRLDFTMTTRPVGTGTVSSVTQTFAAHPPVLQVKMNIPLNLMTSYSNSTGTSNLGDITGGALFLYVLGDYSNTGSGGQPTPYQACTFNGDIRLSFTNID